MELNKIGPSEGRGFYELQLQIFQELLTKYKDFDTNPAAEPFSRTELRFQNPQMDFYFILQDGEKIGIARVLSQENGNRLSSLGILPQWQGKGYAQKTITLLESKYPQVDHWELDTIRQEEKLCYLYEKMGYRLTGESQQIQDGMDLVVYKKQLEKA